MTANDVKLLPEPCLVRWACTFKGDQHGGLTVPPCKAVLYLPRAQTLEVLDRGRQHLSCPVCQQITMDVVGFMNHESQFDQEAAKHWS